MKINKMENERKGVGNLATDLAKLDLSHFDKTNYLVSLVVMNFIEVMHFDTQNVEIHHKPTTTKEHANIHRHRATQISMHTVASKIK